jgi:hypothetical protein
MSFPFVTEHNFYWFLIGYVIAAYVIDWAADRSWFTYVDWSIARTRRAKDQRRSADKVRSAAKEPARRRYSLPRPGRAMRGTLVIGRVI